MSLKPNNLQTKVPLFVTIPHSGEEIPECAMWLKGLPEVVLMGDVDRFVDRLYLPVIEEIGLLSVKTRWHRYAADLNRLSTDVDEEAVVGSSHKKGTFPRGFHWVYNTQNEKILNQPLTTLQHEQLVKLVYEPFHHDIHEAYKLYENEGYKKIYHLDLHSMPSVGTNQHRDPGQLRADIVISDSHGTSCDKKFLELVVASFKSENLSIAYNWPYFGGRLTEQYGQPNIGHNVLQIELNRSLYMNELTKQLVEDKANPLTEKLTKIIKNIYNNL